MLNSIANRSLCFLILFNINESLNDCNMVITKINELKEDEKKLDKNFKLFIKCLVRKVIILSQKGKFEDALNIIETIIPEEL